MTTKNIFELFPARIKQTLTEDNTVEMVDFYSGEYGRIFYKGQEVYEYEKESGIEKLGSYTIVNKLIKMGLSIETAKVVEYSFEVIKDMYPNNLTAFDSDESQFVPYADLVQQIQTDLIEIENLAQITETKYKNACSLVRVLNFKELTQ